MKSTIYSPHIKSYSSVLATGRHRVINGTKESNDYANLDFTDEHLEDIPLKAPKLLTNVHSVDNLLYPEEEFREENYESQSSLKAPLNILCKQIKRKAGLERNSNLMLKKIKNTKDFRYNFGIQRRKSRVRRSLDAGLTRKPRVESLETEYGNPQHTSSKLHVSKQSLFKEFLLLHKNRTVGTSHSNTHLYSGCSSLRKDPKTFEMRNRLKPGNSLETKEARTILPGMSNRYLVNCNISNKLQKNRALQRHVSETSMEREDEVNLERIKEKYETQIKELQEENDKLRKKIEQLESLHTNLIMSTSDSSKDAEVQSFYQNIFITDLQKELDRKDAEISHFKLRILENNDAYGKLQQKNKKSSKIIKMYREMIQNQKEKENMKEEKNTSQELTKTQFDSFMDQNAEIYEIEKELLDKNIIPPKGSFQKMDNEVMNEVLSSFHNNSDSTTIVLQKLYNSIKEISKQGNINDLLEVAEGILSEMFSKSSGIIKGTKNQGSNQLKRGRITFLICNPVVLEAFNMEKKGYANNITIDGFEVFIAHSNKVYHKKSKIKRYNKIKRAGEKEFPFEPCFTSIDQAYYGKIVKGSMCHCCFKNTKTTNKLRGKLDSIHLIVQCDKNMSQNESGIFTSNEHFCLKIITQAISNTIEKIISGMQVNNIIDRTISALEIFGGITIQNNLASIFHSIEEWIPTVFNAKKACVFYIDKNEPQYIFTCTDIGEDEKGTKFIKNVAKFPCNQGYTGKCLEYKKCLVYQPPRANEVERNPEYQVQFKEELDNHVAERIVDWAIYVPLEDDRGEAQGVLQILNKETYGDLLFENNTKILIDKKLNTLSKVIATAIRNANTATSVMSLTHNMQDIMKSVKTMVEGELLIQSKESHVSENLVNISSLIGDIVSDKREKFFQDKILMKKVIEEIKENKKVKIKVKKKGNKQKTVHN
ncbi:unnamed protein product [Moneuplotes crassus]|uniref:GAF domain-containing protein n=1 Tax=Euplotes crassus TaxID=5936 RepID=A0AAD2D7G9_EUPCR|nr:unnamed protein product [Moneuplotes crassus]